jgi:hypothetical protein
MRSPGLLCCGFASRSSPPCRKCERRRECRPADKAIADAERWLGDQKVSLNRGDLGFGHDAIVAWHEAAPARPKFLFKLKLTARVRSALHRIKVYRIKESDWQEPATLGACQIAEARIQITG